MKRIASLLIAVLAIYIIFYDLSRGTLPAPDQAPALEASSIVEPDEDALAYFEQKAVPGETVLTIVERHLDSSVPVSISQVAADFEKLNSGVKAGKIQAGKIYKFPDYAKTSN
ncbi:hypothetical protein [Bacillus infantis]|uniref:LysM domain-containing protein n=1 Tax=Bacillus infantis TaxID=324767 RepID=A0A5D4QYS0_9BACI|nr:hypothetical protein [Bacillus infantis]TYS44283.1 hypothetical protein FZD51_20630 [Bacillus infantis]